MEPHVTNASTVFYCFLFSISQPDPECRATHTHILSYDPKGQVRLLQCSQHYCELQAESMPASLFVALFRFSWTTRWQVGTS